MRDSDYSQAMLEDYMEHRVENQSCSLVLEQVKWHLDVDLPKWVAKI